MKFIPISIFTFIIGFIIASVFGGIFDGGNYELSYLSGITFAVLFLAAVVVISTGLILERLDKLIEINSNMKK